jgi:BON domain-containing protein
MRGQEKLIAGIIMGAGVMYLLDPERGARRRSRLRDQGIHLGRKLGDGVAATARDVRNRSAGTAAELRSRFRRGQVDDEILHDRVRSAIGRVVTHPGAITVTVSDGRVTLTGHVLADELDDLIERVQRVRGVSEVRNELEMHRSADGVPALQGAGRSREQGPQAGNWAARTRLLLGAAGGVIAVKGTRMKGPGGRALTFLGSGILSRAASSVPPRRLVDLGSDDPNVQVHGGVEEKTSPTNADPAPAESAASSVTAPAHSTKSTTKRRRSRR